MECISNHDVVLLKSVSQDAEQNEDCDPYVQRLKQLHLSTVLVPTLDFCYKNLGPLFKALNTPDVFSGIIFISPRCVHAVINCLNDFSNGLLKEDWRLLKIFAVGDSTGKLVSMKLNLCTYQSSTSLSSLVSVIEQESYEKPLLIPCGNLHDTGEEAIFKTRNINVKHIEVYNTFQHRNLLKNLSSVFTNHNIPRCLVFFSPSGVRSVIPHIPKNCIEEILFVAIGPTTSNALLKMGVNVSSVCEKPTEDDVAKTVISLFKK